MQNQSDDVDRIEKNINKILRAGGFTPLRSYSEKTEKKMREAMRRIMDDSYFSGSNDCRKVMARHQR